MNDVIIALLIMGGLGALFATILAVAYRFLRVEEDPRLEVVQDMLPGNNCGACGVPGCSAFAGQVVAGDASPARCTVASAAVLEDIAEFLGVEVGSASRQVARLKCAGGEGRVHHLASYVGQPTCQAAVLVDGGGRSCSWGCLGLGDCERVCTFDAIVMNDRGLPVVSLEACTACGDCVTVCPLDLFEVRPSDQKVLVQCNSPLVGDAARARCTVACDACGRCVADGPAGAMEMRGGLPRIDEAAAASLGAEVTWRCPTGAIQWVEGEQFAQPGVEPWERRRHA